MGISTSYSNGGAVPKSIQFVTGNVPVNVTTANITLGTLLKLY
jgi:hypothetical protein